MTSQSSQAAYLQQNKAWNWKWPGERNQWHTNAKRRGNKQAYTGPSKHTLQKRAAKAKDGKKH